MTCYTNMTQEEQSKIIYWMLSEDNIPIHILEILLDKMEIRINEILAGHLIGQDLYNLIEYELDENNVFHKETIVYVDSIQEISRYGISVFYYPTFQTKYVYSIKDIWSWTKLTSNEMVLRLATKQIKVILDNLTNDKWLV